MRADVFRCSPNNGHRQDTSVSPFRANIGSSHTIRSARGRSPSLDVKLGPGRQGRVEFAVRRLVKAQPKMRKTLQVGSKQKKEPQPKPDDLH
jgi:hypothetical protein